MDNKLALELLNVGVFPKKWEYNNEKADFECLVQQFPEYQVISFQGSKSPKDYIFYLMFIPWLFQGHLIHLGVQLGMRKAWREYIAPAVDFNKKTYVVGHSLGGARAGLFTATYGKQFEDLECVTFASLRFEHILTKFMYYNLAITRYEVRGDIVPHLPPWLFGYCHHGEKIKIGPKKFIDFSAHPEGNYRKELAYIVI